MIPGSTSNVQALQVRRVPGIYRHIPNMLTLARLGLTAVFFVLLNVHGPAGFADMMWVAFAFFVVAAGTDALDGYLARHWHVESVFGRIVDPFVDKILVCGAFIFFAAPQLFYAGPEGYWSVPGATGVAPWMPVVIIAREFLVTGIRGFAESRGIDFRADWAGKIKMIVQCIAIGAILVDLATGYVATPQPHYDHVPWLHTLRDVLIWVTVFLTAASATTYVLRARRLIKE